MLASCEIEAKIVDAVKAAFSAAGVPLPAVCTSWNGFENSLSRWVDSHTAPVAIDVKVSLPSHRTYSTHETGFSCEFDIVTRIDEDPAGEKMLAAVEVVDNLLRAWQRSNYQQHLAVLDTTTFRLGDITTQEGSTPTVADGNAAVVIPFTLAGAFKD